MILTEKETQEIQKHSETLQQVLNGTVPDCNCNDSRVKNYEPQMVSEARNYYLLNITMECSCLGIQM